MTRTNALLGYPDDARLLIINADDFGLSHSANEAILRAWRDGVVASTSLMVPCPWAPHAMSLLRDHPDLPFGVHLTIIREFVPYRWGPVAPVTKVPSLVDRRGHFLYDDEERDALLSRADINEVEIEFRAQIDDVLAEGLRPTHLDFHCLPDGGRDDIFDLALRLAREYGLALRAHFPHSAAKCHKLGLPANDHPVLDSYSMDPATKTEQYVALLREMPPGLNEWAVHPGLGNDETRALEPGSWQVRRADLDAMVSPEVRNAIEEHGITVIDYRALQAVWTGTP
ncbi:MAG TPA: polysaccharide deacetylase family protein [Thermomicrobiales bacterium]|nr:polysaccharide deacetylase family protein [Thermomicrobiales bacterium]